MRVPQNRWQAFLVHLGLSAVVFLILLYFIVFYWYPQPYFSKDGGWQGVRLIMGVDLVLGPLLTLIVYRLGKPRLKLDLAMIGLVQLTALIWGTALVYGERIALVTYANGSFYTLTPEQVGMLGGKVEKIAQESGQVPPYTFVRLPADRKERSTLLRQAMFKGMTPYHFADQHEPYGKQHLPEIIAESTDPKLLSMKNPEFESWLESFLRDQGGTAQDYIFVPVQNRYGGQMLALRQTDGMPVDGFDLSSKSAVQTSNDK